MRIILGLAVSLTLILSTNAALFPLEVGPEIEPKLPEAPPKPINDPPSEPENYHSPPGSPGGSETAGKEDKQESDIAETRLSVILDAMTSIMSLASDGGTSTTITSTIALPTAAYPCPSAQKLLNSCSSQASSSYAVAGPSTVRCIAAGDPCVTAPSGPKTAVASMQSSCVCPPATGLFDDYLGTCNAHDQAQTQLATQSSLATAAFITIVVTYKPNNQPLSTAAQWSFLVQQRFQMQYQIFRLFCLRGLLRILRFLRLLARQVY